VKIIYYHRDRRMVTNQRGVYLWNCLKREEANIEVMYISCTENLLVMEVLCSIEYLFSIHRFMNPTGYRIGL
jgi:hypothetical protein